MAQSPKTSQGMASLSVNVRLSSTKGTQPIRCQPPLLTMEVEAVTLSLHWIARDVTVRPHITIPHKFNELATNWVEWEAQTSKCQLMFDIHLRKLLWIYALDMPEWKEMMEQIGGQSNRHMCLASLKKVLRSLRHYLRSQSQGVSYTINHAPVYSVTSLRAVYVGFICV